MLTGRTAQWIATAARFSLSGSPCQPNNFHITADAVKRASFSLSEDSRKSERYSSLVPSLSSHKNNRKELGTRQAELQVSYLWWGIFVFILSYLPQCLVLLCFLSGLSFPTLLRNVCTNAENRRYLHIGYHHKDRPGLRRVCPAQPPTRIHRQRAEC